MLCYIIGYPISHSMSAVMHNAAFMELELDFTYQLLETQPENLLRVVTKTITASNVRGASVTIPHKVSVMRHLHEIDCEAMRIGAVNTIVNDGGILKGYNTDGIGALRAVRDAYGDLSNARVTILGAGGAARAICYELAKNVSEIKILNRTLRHAEDLSNYLSKLQECHAETSGDILSKKNIKASLADADILVNATPLGMHPNANNSPVSSEFLGPGLLVFDTVYNPPITKLLRDANAKGSRILSGVYMLVYQGGVAFKLWTGKDAPETLMMKTVINTLRGKET